MHWLETASLRLSLAATGLLLRAIAAQWRHDALPAAPAALARAIGATPDEMAEHWPDIERLFERRGDDLVIAHIDAERQRAEELAAQRRRNGTGGGRPRKAGSEPNATPSGSSPRTEREPEAKPSGFGSVNQKETGSEPGFISLSSVRTSKYEEQNKRETLWAREEGSASDPGALPPKPTLSSQTPRQNTPTGWKGPLFNIPKSWAERALKASNGHAVDADIPAFGRWLTERLQRTNGEAPTTTREFFDWLNTGWTEFRGSRSKPTTMKTAEEIAAEDAAVHDRVVDEWLADHAAGGPTPPQWVLDHAAKRTPGAASLADQGPTIPAALTECGRTSDGRP